MFDVDSTLIQGEVIEMLAAKVGADVDESVRTRDRVRVFARSRLDHPGADAFLAEILAAESDY